jgi:hypothetical protein
VIGLTGHTGFDAKVGEHLDFEIRHNPSHSGLQPDNTALATVLPSDCWILKSSYIVS